MSLRYWILGVIPLAVGACSSSTPPSAVPSTPTPTLNIEATVEARVRARLPVPDSATAADVTLSTATKDAIEEFALAQRQISDDWAQFHRDFDDWRAGLVACETTSAEAQLRRFARLASGITSGAGDLPRTPSVRELADRLIEAAEAEEKAFTNLRDAWRPDAPEVFDELEAATFGARAAHRDVGDRLLDLNTEASPSSRTLALAFSSAVDEINLEWDEFHQEYDQFRLDEPELSSSDVVLRLSQLVFKFSSISEALRGLPHQTLTAQVSDALLEAAAAEEVALRDLRDNFEGEAEGNEQPPVSPAETPGGTEGTAEAESMPNAEGQEEPTAHGDSAAFRTFGAHLVEANNMRRQASGMLAGLISGASEKSRLELQRFEAGFRDLVASWRDLHEDFDDWRLTEGGCDSVKASEALGRFVTRFSGLANDVRGLPAITPLRALGEIFVEAAEREEEALRSLRDAWRPFDSDVYLDLERKRTGSATLRRQVTAGLGNLLAEAEITLPEP